MAGGINSRKFCYDLTPGGDGASSYGKRRLIRGEGFATRISGNVRPQEPGGGALTIAAPRQMMDVDVSDTPELSGGGGGGAQSVPSRISVVLVEEAMAGGTPRLGCPSDDQRERQPARGTTVLDRRVLGGRCPIPGLPVLMLQMHQRCPVGGSVGSLTDFGGVDR